MFARHIARFRYLNLVPPQTSTVRQARWKRRHLGLRIFQRDSQNIANPIRDLTLPVKLEYPRQAHRDLGRGHPSASPPKLLTRPESSSAQYLRCSLRRELRAPEELSSLPSIPPLLLKVPSCRSRPIQLWRR